jgi:hypothetical protein
MKDVFFLQLYLSELADNFKSAEGKRLKASLTTQQIANMDADASGGFPTSADARFLSRINFGLLRFLSAPQVKDPRDLSANGLVHISISAFAKGGVAPPRNRTTIFVLVSHEDAALHPEFAETTVKIGSRIDKAVSNSGTIIAEMVLVGPFYGDSETEDQPPECTYDNLNAADSSESNLECNNPNATVYVFDEAAGLCARIEEASECASVPAASTFAAEKDCENMCRPQWKHTVALETDIVDESIGVSFVQITYSYDGLYESGRDVLMSTTKCSTCNSHLYQRALDENLPVQSRPGAPIAGVKLVAAFGYSPWWTFANGLASSGANNLFDPEFVNGLNFSVAEGRAVPVEVAVVNATDQDYIDFTPKPIMSYEVVGCVSNDATPVAWCPFQMHSTNGSLTLHEELDYENETHRTFFVEISASDGAPPAARSARSVVRLDLIDTNDNVPIMSPLFELVCAPRTLRQSDETLVTLVAASDADSNTVEGGQNAALSFSGTSSHYRVEALTGRVYAKEAADMLGNPTVDVSVVDGGVPLQSISTNLSVTECTEDIEDAAVIITTLPSFKDFMAHTDGTGLVNECIIALEELLETRVMVREAAPRSDGDLTELTLLIPNLDSAGKETGTYMSKEKVKEILASKSRVTLNGDCTISPLVLQYENEATRWDAAEAELQFYADAECTVATNPSETGTLLGVPGHCLSDVESQLSGRVYCRGDAGMGLTDDDGEVALRVYDNVACNPRRLNVTSVAPPTNDGLGESGCFQIGQAAGMAGGVVRYAKASCARMTTTMTSTATTTPTTQEPYVKSKESLSTTATAMIGVSASMLICWCCIIFICLRYRNRKEKSDFTGDVDPLEFGAPQPMQASMLQLDGFQAGGEIDPMTGEVMLYGGDNGMAETSFGGMNFGQGTVRLPGNANGDVRANPLFSSGASGISSDAGDYLAMGDSELDDLDGIESIGSLSDFDEADFEDFADSLLADSVLTDLPGLASNMPGLNEAGALLGGSYGNGGAYSMGEVNYNTNVQQRINIGRNSIDFDLDDYVGGPNNDLEFENVGLAVTTAANGRMNTSATRAAKSDTVFVDDMVFENANPRTTRKVHFAGGNDDDSDFEFSNQNPADAWQNSVSRGGSATATNNSRRTVHRETVMEPPSANTQADENTYGEIAYNYTSDNDSSLDLDDLDLGGEVVVAQVEYDTIGGIKSPNSSTFSF